MAGDRYLLDNQQAMASERLDALGALFDATTCRHLEMVGLAQGWRVWEVGAGGSRLPRWIADQTNVPVLATDIETALLNKRDPLLRVKTHDIGVDPAPREQFDLIHARLVLVHVTRRAEALQTMVEALAPGGWLVLEEADPGLQPLVCPDGTGAAQQLANQLKAAFRTLMAERGVDLAFGRTLPRLIREAGLLDVAADAYFPIGGPTCDELERTTIEQIRGQLIEAELATEDQIERHLANISSGQLDLTTSPLISAWGRKPLGNEVRAAS